MKKHLLRFMAGMMVAAMMLPCMGELSMAFAGITTFNPSFISNAPFTDGEKLDITESVFNKGEKPTVNADGSIAFNGGKCEKCSFALPDTLFAGEKLTVTVKYKFGSDADTAVRFYLINGGTDVNSATEICVIENTSVGTVQEKTISLTAAADSSELLFASSGYGTAINDFTIYDITFGAAAPKATATPVPTKAPKATATPAPTKAPKATATPAPTKAPEYVTVGDKLEVTEAMVKNGTVVVESAKYNTIVIPRTISATTVRLMNVKAGTVVVESGAAYDVDIFNGKIDALEVTSPVASGISRAALLKLIQDKATLTEEILLSFQAHTKVMDAIVNLQPEINTYGTTKVDKVTVGGNVKLATNGCAVANVKVDAAKAYEDLKVELAGYAGAVDVALNRAADAGYCLAKLALTNSDVTTVSVDGLGGSVAISGNAVVDKVAVGKTGTVTVATDAKEITVDKKAENATVMIYGKVDTVNAAGKKNDIVLANNAKVTTANVSGEGIRVYGFGKLETAEITGAEANVAVAGALVNGENIETVPAEMKAMSPWKALLEKQNGKEVEEGEDPVDPEDPEEPTPGGDEFITVVVPKELDFATGAVVAGEAPTADGDSLKFAAANNKYRFDLPEAVAAGETLKFSADFNFTDLATNSVVRFYLISGGADSALSEVHVVKTSEVDDTAVVHEFELTATAEVDQILFITFAWDGSTPQEVTLNSIALLVEEEVLAPDDEEESLDLTYDLSELELSGYGYTVEDGVVTFSGQYQEIRYTLPEALPVADFESLIVNITSTEGGAVALKLFDENDKVFDVVKYGVTGNFTWNFSELNQESSITKFALMANDAASSVTPTTIVFVAKEAGTEPEEPENLDKTYVLGDLALSGYGYTVEDGVVTFSGQYQEIRYTLPEALPVADYATLKVNITSTEGGAVALKLFDENDQVFSVVKYGITGDATWDLSELSQESSITKFALMANDAASSVTPTTIEFIAK